MSDAIESREIRQLLHYCWYLLVAKKIVSSVFELIAELDVPGLNQMETLYQ